MILQVSETLKEVDKLAGNQGREFALLALVLVAAGIFMSGLVWFLLKETSKSRGEFLLSLKEISEQANHRNEKMMAAIEKLSDAVRDRRK